MVLESPLNIAVIGAGIGGLAAGLCFAKKGFEVTIFEKSNLKGELGAGIQLSPNSLRVLFSLGMERPLRSYSSYSEFIAIRDWKDGALIKKNPLNPDSEQTYGYPYLHIHRGDLMKVMLDTIKADKRISLRTMSGVAAVNEMVSKCAVKLDSGSEESFDLVIGADGRNSIIRELAGINFSKKIYKENILVTEIKHSAKNNNTSFEIHRNGSLLTSVPTGDKTSAIVMIDHSQIIDDITTDNLDAIIHKSLSVYLGDTTVSNEYSIFPSETINAEKLYRNRVMPVSYTHLTLPTNREV